jgi:quercetin dioxygenase-like cupin family protein
MRAGSGKRCIHLTEKETNPMSMSAILASNIRRAFGITVAATLLGAAPSWAQTPTAPASGRNIESVLSEKLSISPGKVLTSQIVHYPPGGASKSHRHDADVFAFVLSGNIISQTEGHGDEKVYHAGEGRFERRGEHHVVSRNASTTEPASMLVVYVHNESATLTTFDH